MDLKPYEILLVDFMHMSPSHGKIVLTRLVGEFIQFKRRLFIVSKYTACFDQTKAFSALNHVFRMLYYVLNIKAY